MIMNHTYLIADDQSTMIVRNDGSKFEDVEIEITNDVPSTICASLFGLKNLRHRSKPLLLPIFTKHPPQSSQAKRSVPTRFLVPIDLDLEIAPCTKDQVTHASPYILTRLRFTSPGERHIRLSLRSLPHHELADRRGSSPPDHFRELFFRAAHHPIMDYRATQGEAGAHHRDPASITKADLEAREPAIRPSRGCR